MQDVSLNQLCELDLNAKLPPVRLSSIICTLSSESPEMIERMIYKGMGIARLNFTHGNHESHAKTIKNIREAGQSYYKRTGYEYPLAIALDTCGPDTRTGFIDKQFGDKVELKEGKLFRLTINETFREKGSSDAVFINYENIVNILKKGSIIFIDYGLIELKVEETLGDTLLCSIIRGGFLGSNKSVNFPNLENTLLLVSEKDKDDLLFGVEHKVDFIFASLTRNAAALDEIREILGERGKNIKIIAKIGNIQGFENIEEIVQKADGIMVSRGNLGVDFPIESIFTVQKHILGICKSVHKPCFCDNQVLNSMKTKLFPTYAEISDVANDVLYGGNCTCLSGNYMKPLKSLIITAKIIKEAEVLISKDQFYNILNLQKGPVEPIEGLAISTVSSSFQAMASAILVISDDETAAHLVSKYRPKCPIIGITINGITARQFRLYFGIIPLIFKPRGQNLSNDFAIRYALRYGKRRGFLKSGDTVSILIASESLVRVEYVRFKGDYDLSGPKIYCRNFST
ncbi:unnamed protein product [Diamesa hyperborea]